MDRWNSYEKFITIHHLYLNFRDLSTNSSVSLDFIFNNTQYNWIWYLVEDRKDCTEEIILKYPQFEWCFRNGKISVDIVKLHPDLPWNLYNIANEYIPIDMVAKHPNLRWNFFQLSSHLDLTLDIVHNNVTENWTWSTISERNDFILNEWKCYKRILEWYIALAIFSNDLQFSNNVYLLIDIVKEEYPYKTDMELLQNISHDI